MKQIEALFCGVSEVMNRIRSLTTARSIIAIAGPPGGGKSLFATQLSELLNIENPGCAAVIPVDGFHYDDAVLTDWKILDRKGSPGTFDVGGLKSLLCRLRSNDEPFVAVPTFDRDLEIARAGGRIVYQSVRYLVMEGNYLLLASKPWSELAQYFDLECIIQEDMHLLESRLLDRWSSHGLPPSEARHKVDYNDLPNARLVMAESRTAELVLRSQALANLEENVAPHEWLSTRKIISD